MKLMAFVLLVLLLASTQPEPSPHPAQTRERRVTRPDDEVVKVDVDLVVLDALVLRKKTASVVGGLKREDFLVYEDGVKQEVTHFTRDSLPLSVLLLVDRGACLDPFGTEVRRATLSAIERLKPEDEVALMAYHDTAELIEGFTRDRAVMADALERVPPHHEDAEHCLDVAFHEAAEYVSRAGNPVGRRVIIVITGVTSSLDCSGAPSVNEAKNALFESGSVVCGIIPRSPVQRMEDGGMRVISRVGGLFKVPYLSVNKMAEETGGEVLGDKPEMLDRTFTTLIEHLRSRYSLGFVPTNRKRDGGLRKLKLKVSPEVEKKEGKLAIKSRQSYVAPKG